MCLAIASFFTSDFRQWASHWSKRPFLISHLSHASHCIDRDRYAWPTLDDESCRHWDCPCNTSGGSRMKWYRCLFYYLSSGASSLSMWKTPFWMKSFCSICSGARQVEARLLCEDMFFAVGVTVGFPCHDKGFDWIHNSSGSNWESWATTILRNGFLCT